MTTSIVSHKEMKNIMKIDKSLEESGLLIEGVSEKIENKTKEQKCVIQAKVLSKVVKEQIQQERIFNTASDLNQF